MRSKLIIVIFPRFDLLFCVFQRHGPIDVQALIPETAVERLDLRIVGRLARPGIIRMRVVEMRQGSQPGTEDEFRSIYILSLFTKVG